MKFKNHDMGWIKELMDKHPELYYNYDDNGQKSNLKINLDNVIQAEEDSNNNLYLLMDDRTLYINGLSVKDKYMELYSYSLGFVVGITEYNCVKVLFNDCTYINQEKWTDIIENHNKPYKKILYDVLYLACLTKENKVNIIWFNFEIDDKGEPTANEILEIPDIDNIFPYDECNCYLKMIDGNTVTIKDYMKKYKSKYLGIIQ